MELKRRSHFSLLKKLTAFLICFSLLGFILFNYICSDSQCYWIANRYSYARGRFFRRQANQTAADRPSRLVPVNSISSSNLDSSPNSVIPASSAPFDQENQHLKNRPKVRHNNEPVKWTNSTDQPDLRAAPNRSDQLISSKRKGRIVNLSEPIGEPGSRFKYLNLINHPATNRSLLHLNRVTYDQMVNSNNRRYRFDFEKDDVLIFLHIQKTGGTAFGKRLVGDLQLRKPCECFKDKKHCSCIRSSWKDLEEKDQLKLAYGKVANEKAIDEKIRDEKTAEATAAKAEVAKENATVEETMISQRSVDATNESKLLSLVQPSKQSKPSKSRSKARSKYWLFSRYSTGWICGLHADWTQLNYCADDALNRIEKVKLKRRFFFITILRDPVARFLSEFGHVRRGATWRASRFACSNEFEASNENSNEMSDKITENGKKDQETVVSRPGMELNVSNSSASSRCYSGDDWRGVDLEEYTSCETNLAINRQTRMLADLSKVGCSNNGNRTEYNQLLLESAKYNLKRLAYFGLLEHQKVSQFVFESTFNFSFQHSFLQLNRTHSTQIKTNLETIELIRQLNSLDMQLYAYAKELLFERFAQLKKANNFEEFERSKLNSLDNFKQNLDKFPELRLFQKFSKIDKDRSSPIDR